MFHLSHSEIEKHDEIIQKRKKNTHQQNRIKQKRSNRTKMKTRIYEIEKKLVKNTNKLIHLANNNLFI